MQYLIPYDQLDKSVFVKSDLSLWCTFSTTCEPCHEKTYNKVSEQVRHKPSCTNTEDGWRLEILDLESRGIVLPM